MTGLFTLLKQKFDHLRAGEYRLDSRSVPWMLLLVMILAFGLLIPWLGFYWDDWPVLLLSRIPGLDIHIEMYQFDRPLSFWIYPLTLPVLGTSSQAWQVASLLTRFATVLAMWASLRLLWPSRTREVTWAALLFAIYPVFLQQPISVAYFQHWLTYLLYFVSIWSMLLALEKRRWFWPLIGLSVLTAALHIGTMEYFYGLELLRPVILWLSPTLRALPGGRRGRFKRLLATARYWIPYLLIIVGFVIWRLFFIRFPAGEDPNNPELLRLLLESPLAGVVELLQAGIQDVVFMLITNFYHLIQLEDLTLQADVTALSWLFAAGAGLLVFVFLYLFVPRDKAGQDGVQAVVDRNQWLRQAFGLGFLIVVFGTLPVWLTGNQVIRGFYSDRFALAAMPGLSLIWVAAIEWLTPPRLQKAVLFSTLIALMLGFHLRNVNNFRHIWDEQRDFYWQMYWRAPALEPGTAVLSEGEIFPYVGDYSTAAALNLLYGAEQLSPNLDYWFFDLESGFLFNPEGWLNGQRINDGLRMFNFEGQSQDSLVIVYEPSENPCLWILGPQDAADKSLTDLQARAAPLSDLDRIEFTPRADQIDPQSIFGPEPLRGWCYLYQQAEVARQQQDWQRLFDLSQEMLELDHNPAEKREYIPFIIGLAHGGDWESASDLTLRALRIKPSLRNILQQTWLSLLEDTAPSPARTTALQRLGEALPDLIQ